MTLKRRSRTAAPFAAGVFTACLMAGPAAAQHGPAPGEAEAASFGRRVPAFECLTPNPPTAPDGLFAPRPWPGGIVPYTFLQPPHPLAPSPEQQEQMLDAMAMIEARTSVRFFEQTTETHYVRVRRNTPGVGGSFSSHIGHCGCGMQEIVIGDNNWIEPGVLIHEWGHALGLYHEHQRRDRGPYIEVHPAVAGHGAFSPIAAITHGPYDMASLMHYDPYWGVGGFEERVLTVKEPYRRAWQYRIGQYRLFDGDLSNGDIWVLHELYPTDPPPRAFELTSPAPGALVGPGWAPSLAWEPSEAADRYRVQVAEDPAFITPVIDIETSGTSYDHPTPLEADRLYWWRVISSNAIGDTKAYPFERLPLYTGAAYPATLYVDDDAPAGGDGASWASPLQELATALEIAHAADGAVTEIRVAAGEYKPDYGSGDREMSFWLPDDCAVRGGYAGFAAPDPDARDIDAHQTILSGDLNGDDLPGFVNIDDNARHVVISVFNPATTLLEGFTIRGGKADRWHETLAGWGGGMDIIGGAPVIRRCRFEGNYAAELTGGVQVAYNEPAPTFERCEFVGNRAEIYAGGLSFWRGAGILTDCIFIDNVAATNVAGGAAVQAMAQVQFVNPLFASNIAGAFGGAALWVADRGEAEVINGTFSANVAPVGGGGALRTQRDGVITAVNSILWGNAAPQVAVFGTGAVGITYSDIQGGWPGTGNINADPLFASPPAGDYTLTAGSPAIDAGDSAAVPAGITTDLAGLPRFVGGIDMGAYEFQGVCYADCDGSGALDFFDFLCFQSQFAAGDPQADCDGSGSLDFFDFLCFQNAFSAGCP